MVHSVDYLWATLSAQPPIKIMTATHKDNDRVDCSSLALLMELIFSVLNNPGAFSSLQDELLLPSSPGNLANIGPFCHLPQSSRVKFSNSRADITMKKFKSLGWNEISDLC